MQKAIYFSVFMVSLLVCPSCTAHDSDLTDAIEEGNTESIIVDNLPNVPQNAFYKDVFLDAGVGLTSRKFLYAADYLGLFTEGISFSASNASDEEIALQNRIIGGDQNDTNGRLLYPDGQPRFRLLFVNGGSSTTHGSSLSKRALDNMKQFVLNGGSYVGTCAGAFFASCGYDDNTNYPNYLSLWPSTINHTGISNTTTGMFIEPDSPLLNYYEFGGDIYVADIRHNGGGYPVDLPPQTEVLALYDYPSKTDVHLQPSVWTYKDNEYTGRVIMEGSHPEEVAIGELRDLTASMILYAVDGVGATTLKGNLKNGEPRLMIKRTEDNDPLFTRIGDLQCHHFVFELPEHANIIRIEVNSSVDCDLQLAVCHSTFAYPEDADYVSPSIGSHQQLFFSELSSGKWFVTVKCHTTIAVTETEYGQSYTDNVDVLNGIPYEIVASWEEGNREALDIAVNGNTLKPSSKRRYYGLSGKTYHTHPHPLHSVFIRGGRKYVR